MQNKAAEGSAHGLGPRRVPGRPVVATAAQAQVYDRLADAGEPMSAAALAAACGQHVNTVREHLDALVDRGLVQRARGQPAGRGRPGHVYGLASGGGERSIHAALVDALVEHVAMTSPDPAAAAEQLGRGYAPRRSSATGTRSVAGGSPAIQAVKEAMQPLGFSPQPVRGGQALRLRTCPLLGVASRAPQVVCSFHVGMVAAVAAQADPQSPPIRLRPFAEPGACVIAPVAESVG